MPHRYNTRARKNSEDNTEFICRDLLGELINLVVPDDEMKGERVQAYARERDGSLADHSQEVSEVAAVRPHSARRSKAAKRKSANDQVLETLGKVMSRLDELDKRVERQEVASAISLQHSPSAHSSPKSHSSPVHRARTNTRRRVSPPASGSHR